MITTWLLIAIFAVFAIIFFMVELNDLGVFTILAIIGTAIIGFWVIPEKNNTSKRNCKIINYNLCGI